MAVFNETINFMHPVISTVRGCQNAVYGFQPSCLAVEILLTPTRQVGSGLNENLIIINENKKR